MTQSPSADRFGQGRCESLTGLVGLRRQRRCGVDRDGPAFGKRELARRRWWWRRRGCWLRSGRRRRVAAGAAPPDGVAACGVAPAGAAAAADAAPSAAAAGAAAAGGCAALSGAGDEQPADAHRDRYRKKPLALWIQSLDVVFHASIIGWPSTTGLYQKTRCSPVGFLRRIVR